MKLNKLFYEKFNHKCNKGTNLHSFVFFVVFILMNGIQTSAQELNKFSISGIVKDQTTGRRLAGIRVEAINEADTTQRLTTISRCNRNLYAGHYRHCYRCREHSRRRDA